MRAVITSSWCHNFTSSQFNRPVNVYRNTGPDRLGMGPPVIFWHTYLYHQRFFFKCCYFPMKYTFFIRNSVSFAELHVFFVLEIWGSKYFRKISFVSKTKKTLKNARKTRKSFLKIWKRRLIFRPFFQSRFSVTL